MKKKAKRTTPTKPKSESPPAFRAARRVADAGRGAGSAWAEDGSEDDLTVEALKNASAQAFMIWSSAHPEQMAEAYKYRIDPAKEFKRGFLEYFV